MRKRHKAPSSWLRCRVAGGSWAQACSRACQDLKAEVQGRDWLPSPTTPAAERHAPAGCLLLAAPALHVCTSHLDGIRFLLRRLAPWHRPPRAASSPRSASKTVMRIHQLPPGCGEAGQRLFMCKPLSLRVCKLFGEAPAASPEPGTSIAAVTTKANAREAGAAPPAAASPRRRRRRSLSQSCARAPQAGRRMIGTTLVWGTVQLGMGSRTTGSLCGT